MTWLAPASFSISAETQPVKAPLSLIWQSSPPALTGVRDRISAARDSKVEGASGSKLPGGGTQFYIPNLTFGDVASYNIRPLV